MSACIFSFRRYFFFCEKSRSKLGKSNQHTPTLNMMTVMFYNQLQTIFKKKKLNERSKMRDSGTSSRTASRASWLANGFFFSVNKIYSEVVISGRKLSERETERAESIFKINTQKDWKIWKRNILSRNRNQMFNVKRLIFRRR